MQAQSEVCELVNQLESANSCSLRVRTHAGTIARFSPRGFHLAEYAFRLYQNTP